METILVETRAFTERVKELLDDETYRLFQNELVRDPTKGQVISGCGGRRKIRVSPKRKSRDSNHFSAVGVPLTASTAV
jgi:hypothetical protein